MHARVKRQGGKLRSEELVGVKRQVVKVRSKVQVGVKRQGGKVEQQRAFRGEEERW